jgi:hypothetical protein
MVIIGEGECRTPRGMGRHPMIKKLTIATAVFLAAAPAALAGGQSSMSGYGGTAGTVQGAVQKSGSLPFTGLSLTAFLIVGLLLIAAGVLVRRRASRSAA